MKILHLTAVVSAAVISFVPVFHGSATAQQNDYDCFMTTQSGQVVDLSESVCGVKKSPAGASANNGSAVISDTDQAFLEDYEQNVMQNPEVRDNLLANAKVAPEQSINQAKNLCNDMKAGLSFNEVQKDYDQEADQKAGIVNAAIINSLATKYYCPEVNDH